MAFLVSPGVQVKETDLTNVIPATSSSIGAIAGTFQWGPADEIITVGSETELVETFGQPSGNTFQCFLQATQFLSYGNTLRVVRALADGTDTATIAAVPHSCSNDENAGTWDGVDVTSCELLFEADGTTAATYTAEVPEVPATTNNDPAVNASASGVGVLAKNDTHFDIDVNLGASDWTIARYPGKIGNSIGISICTNLTGFGTAPWAVSGPVGFATNFNSAPSTSDYVGAVGGSNDEMHVVIYDRDGQITGAANTVLETFEYVSQAKDAMSADGMTNFWKNVINAKSKWVRVRAPSELVDSGEDAAGTDFTTSTNIVADLSGGRSSNANIDVGDIQLAYDLFKDPETVEISLLIQSSDMIGIDNHIAGIAKQRKDCVAFVSPAVGTTVGIASPTAAIKLWADTVVHSSYAFADSGALYVYDKYRDNYRWIMASGTMAGLAANADNVADPWWSPAGFSRGQLLNVTRLAFNPKQADRDDLYKVGINPIVSFAGQGTILYGDKTLQSKPSAFDRINVRRLFITLEKAISTASKFQLFEFNDEFTRAQFRNMVEPFLRDIKGRRGITDFKVVCDETNNTGDVIDTNRFVADLYIKPARSINFITLNFVATRTGVEFSEIAGGK